MHVVRAVIQASGDRDIDAWTKWCNEAFEPTTPPAVLRSSGGERFTSIDLKLAQALRQVIINAGEVAAPVRAEIKAMELERTRLGTSVELTKGRECLSKFVNFFRGTNNTEVLYTPRRTSMTFGILVTASFSLSCPNGTSSFSHGWKDGAT